MEFFHPEECLIMTRLVENEDHQTDFDNLPLSASFDDEDLKGIVFPALHQSYWRL